jgi:hypothetical protein
MINVGIECPDILNNRKMQETGLNGAQKKTHDFNPL